jgi:glycosyltransferase involved in cell wall biosynthesis
MNKIKNVVVINDFDYTQGGASKVAIETANVLTDSYTVYFFSGDSSDKSTLNDKVIKVCTNQGEALKDKNKLRGMINGIYNIKVKKELKKLLNSLDNKNTIIHVHGWTKCLSSSVFDIAWKMGFKVVLTMHDYFTACPNGGYFNYKKNKICTLKPLCSKCVRCNCDSRNYVFKLYRVLRQFVQNKIVKLNDRLTDVISISDFSETVLKKTLNPKVKIHRVYNPIDLDPNPIKVDYKKNDYFLYAGRVSKEKGVDIFCEAITKANVKGVVVGDGSELPKLKEMYPNIEFVGWKNNVEVKEYMKKAKALVFPSRWYEGAPLTTLEAMQFGIPVITSDCNAAIDQVEDGVNGYIFGNVEDLVSILNKKIDLDIPNFNFNKSYCKDLLNCYKKNI